MKADDRCARVTLHHAADVRIDAAGGAVKSGKLRWIAVSSAQRFPGLDDLPTIAETLPGFRIDGWFVVLAPTGTPAPILDNWPRRE